MVRVILKQYRHWYPWWKSKFEIFETQKHSVTRWWYIALDIVGEGVAILWSVSRVVWLDINGVLLSRMTQHSKWFSWMYRQGERMGETGVWTNNMKTWTWRSHSEITCRSAVNFLVCRKDPNWFDGGYVWILFELLKQSYASLYGFSLLVIFDHFEVKIWVMAYYMPKTLVWHK